MSDFADGDFIDYKALAFEALGVTEEEARDWNILDIATGGIGLTEPPLAK